MRKKKELEKLQSLMEQYTRVTESLTHSGNIYSSWNKEKERYTNYLKKDKMNQIQDVKLKKCLKDIWNYYEDSLIDINTYIRKQLYNDPISAKIRVKVDEVQDVSLETTYELEEFINLKEKEEIKILVNMLENPENFEEEEEIESPKSDRNRWRSKRRFRRGIEDDYVNPLKKNIDFLEKKVNKIQEYDIENKIKNLENELQSHKKKFYFFDLLTEVFIKLEHQNTSLGIAYPYNLEDCIHNIGTNSIDILEKEVLINKEMRQKADEKLKTLQEKYIDLTKKHENFKNKFFTQIQMIGDLEEKLKQEGNNKFSEESIQKLIEIANLNPKKISNKEVENPSKELKQASEFLKILTGKLSAVEKISNFGFIRDKELDFKRKQLFENFSGEIKVFEQKMLKSQNFAKESLKNLLNTPVFLRDKVNKLNDKNIQVEENKDEFSKRYSYYNQVFYDSLRYYNEIRVDDNPLEIDFRDCLVPLKNLNENSEIFLIENSMALVSSPGVMNRIVHFGDELGVEVNDLQSIIFFNFFI